MSRRTPFSRCAVVGLFVFLLAPSSTLLAAEGPSLGAGGPLTFGPDDVLFIADNGRAKIVALQLGAQASGDVAGTKDVADIDRHIAALLGTGASEIQINDLAISPTSRNAFLSVSRGRGATAAPVLMRWRRHNRGDFAGQRHLHGTCPPQRPGCESRRAPRPTRFLGHRHGVP